MAKHLIIRSARLYVQTEAGQFANNIRNTLYSQGIVSNRKTLQIAIQELGAQPTPTNKPALNPPSNSTPQPRVKKPRKSYPESPTFQRIRHGPRQKHTQDFPPNGPALSASAANLTKQQASAPPRQQHDASSRRTFNGSAFSQTPSGDPYRDYLAAASRVMSLTGDTRTKSTSC
ncbi:hypothetical protein CC80DRAFT_552000 [Byssothecium circinans]|uniref:Uncharacterized protein n=1 Tax=Byssothecium circinans TaxID=147558 RepID=A0A6A5TJ55_9PLEO|nr:hypothetical protein CC80DRAFT_552000 [Byssothecium circinans]